jgi:hypothetical protein
VQLSWPLVVGLGVVAGVGVGLLTRTSRALPAPAPPAPGAPGTFPAGQAGQVAQRGDSVRVATDPQRLTTFLQTAPGGQQIALDVAKGMAAQPGSTLTFLTMTVDRVDAQYLYGHLTSVNWATHAADGSVTGGGTTEPPAGSNVPITVDRSSAIATFRGAAANQVQVGYAYHRPLAW